MLHGMGSLGPGIAFLASTSCMPSGSKNRFDVKLQILFLYDHGISECTSAIGVEVQNVCCSSLIRTLVIPAVWYEKSS